MTTEAFGVNEEENSNEQMTRRSFLKGAGAAIASLAMGVNGDAESKERTAESPFDPEVQKAALGFVAQAMGVTIDSTTIPLPAIMEAESVSDADFSRMIGFDTEGKRANFFFPPSTIFLIKESESHSLAHEYVHYIQFTYKGVTDGTSDQAEDEAVRIQHLFRNSGAQAE